MLQEVNLFSLCISRFYTEFFCLMVEQPVHRELNLSFSVVIRLDAD
jgi:hypothetical protein